MTSNVPVTHLPKQPQPAHWSRFLRGVSSRHVRVGELALINSGPALMCRAVGSTVAVCFHIPGVSISGVLHVAFPAAKQHRALGLSMPHAFADRGVAELVRIVKEFDVAPSAVQVSLVGGSGLMSPNPEYDGPARLVRAVEVMLTAHGLVVRARHTGGSRARHVHQAMHGQALVVMTGGQQ